MAGFVLLNSGQGLQRPDLIAALARQPRAADLLARCRSALPKAARDWLDAPDEAGLFLDAVSQPMICLAQCLALAAVGGELPEPDLFAGYSLGELACYGAAGAFSPETLVDLAGRRAACMDAAARIPSGLSAVLGLPEKIVGELIAGHGGHVAIVNGPEHVIVGAALADLPGLENALRLAGASRVARLRVPLASHTPLLSGAAATFGNILSGLDFSLPQAAILSGVTAERVWNRKEAVAALANQLEHTVRFGDVIEAAVARGCRVFLELGPGSALCHMVLALHPEVQARSLDEFQSPAHAGQWAGRALTR
jgi:[acyl-carrier-protein] S-malonyltransferase